MIADRGLELELLQASLSFPPSLLSKQAPAVPKREAEATIFNSLSATRVLISLILILILMPLYVALVLYPVIS